MKDRVRKDIGINEQDEEWANIDWQLVDHRVKNLRQRIYRATQLQQWNKVRSLTKLMLRSYSNLLSSVRRVTQENKGRKTAGVDRQLVLTPKGRAKLVENMLEHKLWQAHPARRVYIPKKGGKRPLGIPTIKNRAAQAIMKNALEPSWEARFELNSYGFRPGRSCHDAIEQCWLRLNRQQQDRWVLDSDIKGAFDNISHNFVLDRLGNTPGRSLIKAWLKAGYVEDEIFHATTSGVPQGGIISPLIANIALDGLDSLLKGRYGFIRYADDFVVTARSKEALESIKPVIEEWLAERGLVMNAEKTRIVSIIDGFDFLGFNVRHYHGKCLVKPQKGKVMSFLKEIRAWLKKHKHVSPNVVIQHLNPILRGWAQYYRHAVSKRVFSYVNSQLWRALWRWCLRRHPNKGTNWVKQKYFRSLNGQTWRFFANDPTKNDPKRIIYLINISEISIQRHVKVKGSASPDDPALIEYWNRRKTRRGDDELTAIEWQLLEKARAD